MAPVEAEESSRVTHDDSAIASPKGRFVAVRVGSRDRLLSVSRPPLSLRLQDLPRLGDAQGSSWRYTREPCPSRAGSNTSKPK